MIKKLLRFVIGTYRIEIVRRDNNLLNYIVKNNIKVFNLNVTDEKTQFDCYKSEFKNLQQYLKNNCDYTAYFNGLPVILNKYKSRAGLLIGALIFFVMFYIFSLYVWKIDIVGCKTITKQEIMTRINECGLNIANQKSRLDLKQIENNFLKGYSDVSWVSINIKGTVATVEIRENTRKVKKLDTTQPCSIYASRDGVIASVKAYMGYSVVNIGDTVTAGDLLISGDYTDKYGVNYKLHSMGTVMANTTHTYNVTVDYSSTEQVKTGKSKTFYKLKLATFSIPLYFNKNILYNNYSLNINNIYFEPFKNLVLPFYIEKSTYTQTQTVKTTKSSDVALQDAYEKIRDIESNLVGIKIVDKEYQQKVYNDRVELKATLSCYEDIGVKIEIN